MICIKDGKKITIVSVFTLLCRLIEHKMIFFLFLYFFFRFSNPQKRKRQSAYDGIKYDKLGSSGDINRILKSPLKSKNNQLLISNDDVELNHEKLQQAYDELHDNDLEDDEEENEETRFITNNSKKSSFYTSSERTWSAINSQIIL